MNRRYSKTIYAGTLAIGGNAPISVQSMLNAAAENAEQDSDQNVSDEDTDDSGQDNSDVDENLEEELGTEEVEQSE